jgi:5,6-dimethylbenzimidazole synthase
VRRFKTDPLPPPLIESLVRTAALAPSVGNSQPWRFVSVESKAARGAVIANFNACNAAALKSYEGERAALYASLKLAGLRDAPVHLAVFCDHATEAGFGLGHKTMPETLDYSVVAAVHTFWLAARAQGIGAGWVSILDPDEICRALVVPASWKLIAYLCVGFPEEEHLDPELERHHWQARLVENARLHRR